MRKQRHREVEGFPGLYSWRPAKPGNRGPEQRGNLPASVEWIRPGIWTHLVHLQNRVENAECPVKFAFQINDKISKHKGVPNSAWDILRLKTIPCFSKIQILTDTTSCILFASTGNPDPAPTLCTCEEKKAREGSKSSSKWAAQQEFTPELSDSQVETDRQCFRQAKAKRRSQVMNWLPHRSHRHKN